MGWDRVLFNVLPLCLPVGRPLLGHLATQEIGSAFCPPAFLPPPGPQRPQAFLLRRRLDPCSSLGRALLPHQRHRIAPPGKVYMSTTVAADAKSHNDGIWAPIGAPPAELRCDVTLVCGQTFRWRVTGEKEWTGVIADTMVSLRQTPDDVHVSAYNEGGAACWSPPSCALLESIRDYFHLHVPLAPLYESWSTADAKCQLLAQGYPGLRVLRQDPVECLFSFICSSNNNIARITLMIDRIGQKYGTLLGSKAGFDFYTFPTLERLAEASEEDLRVLGMGYRAKFICKSADMVVGKGGREWLLGLRNLDHMEAREALETLFGVGSKVADCVCLFALDKRGAIPVDTHVWQITIRDFDPSLADAKSMTPTIYKRVGDIHRGTYGEYAGWAHTILFAADLVKFRDRTNEALGTSSESSSPSKTPKGTPSKKGTPKKGASVEPGSATKSTKKGTPMQDESPSKRKAADGGRGEAGKSATKGLKMENESGGALVVQRPKGGLGSPRKKLMAAVKSPDGVAGVVQKTEVVKKEEEEL